MKIFLLSLLVTIVYSIFESLHDINVIKNDKGWSDYSKKWHAYGFILNFLFFAIPLTVLAFIIEWYLCAILLLICGIIFYQLHDSIIGYGLHKDIFYLGNNGYDAWIKRVFYNGQTVSAIRLLFLICAISAYFYYL